jgi:hypothetical protein
MERKRKFLGKENLIVIENYNVSMNEFKYEYKLPVAFLNSLILKRE